MKETIYTPYSPEYDMTFIVRDIWDENENIKSTEVIGFYYGEPDETATAEFKNKLKAEY